MPAGSALGMWTLFEDQPRRVSAVALEPTRALVVDREDFFDVLGEHVSIVRSVLGDLVQRLHNVAV
jgi:CRP-like cAMP-binding protein